MELSHPRPGAGAGGGPGREHDELRVALRHVCPQCIAPYLIVVSTTMGTAILMEASLSFLGVGVPPPEPSWGRMLSGVGRDFLLRAPWISFFPGLAISLTVLGFNLLGDALRDVWDPRLRGAGRAVGDVGLAGPGRPAISVSLWRSPSSR